MKTQKNDENETLLNDKKGSCTTNDHHRHHSSRLEWAESSWTRFLHVLFWWWIKPMLYIGYKRQLTVDDLDGIPHVDKALVLLDRLSSYDWSSTTTWRIVCKEFWKDYILLCWIIQPIPTLCGYALFPVFILFQLYFSRKFSHYHEITVVRTDKRVQAFSECIHGCHIVKMYNWEKPLSDRIIEIRENESASIRRASHFRALNMTFFFMSVSLFALTTFGSAWLLGYPLNIENTFPALALFSVMRFNAMYYIPLAIEKLSVVKSASRRIDSFMHLTMKQDNQSQLSTSLINEQQKGHIIISNASFSWHNEIPCLSLSDLTIEQGTLVGIVGPVGSGKSSLFAAILGEINLINGQLNTNNSSFSYAAQSPWTFEDTFRNNILLNRSFDQQRYRNVIHACCLDDDISVFGSSEDLIMIGENGFNLSGGQKARVSLARALYSDADIYLLDDPLSAVDHKVAKQIYERCIGSFGLLKNKTRLLVTHQTQFLNESHQIIFLSHGHIDKQGCLNENIIRENDSNKNETSKLVSLLDDHRPMDDLQSIVIDEKPLNDGTRWSIWYHFFTAPPFARIGFCVLIVVLLLGEALSDGANYWLSICLQESGTNQQIAPKSAYIYFGLIMATVIVDFIRTNYYFTIVLNGSNNLHNKMLRGLLYTSIQFFESNPSGRILNRASKDQFKRLESITRSPVYAFFSSSFNGSPTIRSLKAETSFIQLIARRIDTHTSAYFLVLAASQLFSVMLNIVCSLILIVASIRIIHAHDPAKSSISALRLMNAIFVALWFQWALRELSEADIMMISAERIDEYSRLPLEDDRGGHKGLVKTSPTWPAHGKIEFRNYSLRHRLNLEYAIRNVDLCIESGQKIGIIGRTGAGKSSIFKGIFRLVNRSCVDGEILIDDIDISRITLNHLRSHLSVIPQQPVLFSGTLRYNLDPFDHYSDEQCWMALEDAQLKQFVSNHSVGLLMPIGESGKTLSIGQCQLVCIARAILQKSKILLVDEATANVDQKTDDVIQAVLKNKFQDRTILTIAHRLNTVAQHDRILVLDKGMIANFDTPTNILHSYY
ncbi:unnamed protein product [Rotaria sp. Silwood1]|nr:unnamed protein product [Rotaria sp. Silwood1]CAF4831617.1 unnamed protein product [Rotaria sp. Silwood1]